MKRTIAVAAATILAATGLTACSQSNDTSTDPAASSAATSATAAPESSSAAETSDTADDNAEDTASQESGRGTGTGGGQGDGTGGGRETDKLAEFAGPEPAEGVPATVSGYTQYAQRELQEENITEAEVEEVVAAGAEQRADEVEWDDDGYWEIEFNDIDVDIRPDGVVHEVDR